MADKIVVWINHDERYPVFSFERELPYEGAENVRVRAEIDEATLARWEEAMRRFDEAQDEMQMFTEFKGRP